MVNKKSLASQSLLYAIGNISNKVVGFLLLPLYTHFLSPHDYGVIEIIDLLIAVSAIVFGVQAIGSAMIRVYHDQQENADKKHVLATSMWLSALVSSFIAAVIVATSGVLATDWLGEESLQRVIVVSAITLVFSGQIELLLIWKRIEQRAVYFVVFSVARLIVSVTLNVIFIAYYELGVLGFAYSALISSVLGFLVLYPPFIKQGGAPFVWAKAKDVIKLGYPLILAGVAFFVIHFADRFILNHYTDLAQVGFYSLAYKFGFLVTTLVGEPFGRVWNVNVFAYAKDEGWEAKFARVFLYFNIALLWVGLGICLFVDGLLGWIIDYKFAPAMQFVAFIVVAYILRELGDFFRQLLMINRKSGKISSIAAVAAILNVVLCLGVVPIWGALGAAIVTLITWGSYMLMNGALQHHYFSIKFPWLGLAGLWASMVILVVFDTLYSGQNFWYEVLSDVGLMIAFTAAIWLLGGLDGKEKQQLILYANKLLPLGKKA